MQFSENSSESLGSYVQVTNTNVLHYKQCVLVQKANEVLRNRLVNLQIDNEISNNITVIQT